MARGVMVKKRWVLCCGPDRLSEQFGEAHPRDRVIYYQATKFSQPQPLPYELVGIDVCATRNTNNTWHWASGLIRVIIKFQDIKWHENLDCLSWRLGLSALDVLNSVLSSCAFETI
jgi:hypothetical protein